MSPVHDPYRWRVARMVSSKQVVIALGVKAIGRLWSVVGFGRRAPHPQAGPRDLETVREVKKHYGDEILRRYNAVGHGISTARKLDSPPGPEDEVYVINVHLRFWWDKPKTPQQIGGVPLEFTVTGTFRPL